MKAAPPDTAIPYDGKQHRWALASTTRLNGRLSSLTPTVGLLAFTIMFNKSKYASQLYSWMNSNYTPWQINAWGTFILTSVVYWIGGLAFMLVDLWDPLFNLAKPYKLQPDKRVPWKDYKRVLWIVARNQVFVALPLTIAMATFAPLRTTTPLPGALETILVWTWCMLCEEAGFYYVHRTFHHPKLYKHVHKMHHQFTAPVAFASTYCTVVEHVFSNLLPNVLGVIACKAHWSLMCMFFIGLELGTLSTHSDFNLPLNYNALLHDWHHYAYTENFGPTGLLDAVYGTDKNFRTWLAELHRRENEADVVKSARQDLVEKENVGASGLEL
ncbi:hypothetical protein ACM66B_002252 [Microbotryomycetes sp. NB124-2]